MGPRATRRASRALGGLAPETHKSPAATLQHRVGFGRCLDLQRLRGTYLMRDAGVLAPGREFPVAGEPTAAW